MMSDHVKKMFQAFTDENPFAERAAADLAWLDNLMEGPADPRTPHVLARASANATLALAYEQRQTRYDLETALANHAQQTMAP